MLPKWFLSLAVWLVVLASSFPSSSVRGFSATPRRRTSLSTSVSSPEISLEDHHKTLSEVPCYWKPAWPKSRWQRRIHLEDLRVGQKLEGTVVQELLDGRTGPKIFFEVGVGRTDAEGKWSIVNAMLRLDRAKESVTKKRVTRLRKKESVELWVSRIQADCSRLEVCLEEESIKKYQSEPKVPVSTLTKGTEVKGRVVRIFPFGVMVDVGANRHGLLHIKKVREIYGRYIDKEKGLIEAGLERGAKVRLCVESVDKRRLSLDFTEDVKNDAKAELEAESAVTLESEEVESVGSEAGNSGLSEEELAEWAAFASAEDNAVVVNTANQGAQDNKSDEVDDEEKEYDDDEDDYDDYDEERDIEDSLGLGYY